MKSCKLKPGLAWAAACFLNCKSQIANCKFLLLLLLLSSPLLAATKVTINEDLVIVIDGKKVFPIGFTMPPPPDGKTPTGKNAIDELGDAGATFLRIGVMATNWNEATFDLQQKWLDAAARNNMYCLFNLREASSI